VKDLLFNHQRLYTEMEKMLPEIEESTTEIKWE
jgi:hypothetical protein